MRWFMPKLRNSLYAVMHSVHPSEAARAAEHPVDLEDIRQHMLDLASLDGGERAMRLVRRIRYASDLEALWFMRGELMGQLAATLGEAAAFEKVEALSALFADLLPAGLRSRPSPLGANYRPNRFESDD
jgi:hypothetical protein